MSCHFVSRLRGSLLAEKRARSAIPIADAQLTVYPRIVMPKPTGERRLQSSGRTRPAPGRIQAEAYGAASACMVDSGAPRPAAEREPALWCVFRSPLTTPHTPVRTCGCAAWPWHYMYRVPCVHAVSPDCTGSTAVLNLLLRSIRIIISCGSSRFRLSLYSSTVKK